MKMVSLIMILGILIILFGNGAFAGDPHGAVIEKSPTNNYYTSEGVASAISAANCSFDSSTFDLQLCGAVGYTDNTDAVTFGIGKKYKDFLINGTISSEDNRTSFGAAINWKIK